MSRLLYTEKREVDTPPIEEEERVDIPTRIKGVVEGLKEVQGEEEVAIETLQLRITNLRKPFIRVPVRDKLKGLLMVIPRALKPSIIRISVGRGVVVSKDHVLPMVIQTIESRRDGIRVMLNPSTLELDQLLYLPHRFSLKKFRILLEYFYYTRAAELNLPRNGLKM